MDRSEVNLLDPAIQGCPFHAYKKLRDEAPVYRLDNGYYVVTRYDDIWEVIRNPEKFSMAVSKGEHFFQHEPAREIYRKDGFIWDSPLSSDPPIHSLYRKLVDVSFTARRVKSLDWRIAELIDSLIDKLEDGADVEFVQDFCVPLPMTVIADRLGLPLEDLPLLKEWSEYWVEPYTLALSPERELFVAQKGAELNAYMLEWLERKRKNPGDDILTDIVNARYNDERPLTNHEMLGLAGQVLVGGNETTTNALSMGMKYLIETPGLEDRLRSQPVKIKTFVEEVLRLGTPTQGLSRLATRDVELGGVMIPKGSVVHLRWAAANRDERQFPEPDALDVDRKNAGSHMSFSQAHHHCLGAPLARQEMQLTFDIFLKRKRNLRFAPGKNSFEFIPGFTLRALKELWIQFDANPDYDAEAEVARRKSQASLSG